MHCGPYGVVEDPSVKLGPGVTTLTWRHVRPANVIGLPRAQLGLFIDDHVSFVCVVSKMTWFINFMTDWTNSASRMMQWWIHNGNPKSWANMINYILCGLEA
jgi:hypothetical protein